MSPCVLHALFLFLLSYPCSITAIQPAPEVATAARPNIVLILADDLGVGDLECMNPRSRIPTPGMDAIAEEGMRFTDAHAAAAVCTPSRYGLLTGRYCWRGPLKRWVLGGSSPALIEADRETLASLLSSVGYRTACVGKWHLGLGDQDPVDWDQPLRPGPADVGFDEFYGIPASLDMPPYIFVENDRPEAPATASVEHSKHRRQGGEGFWRAGAASEGFEFQDVMPKITARAVDTITRFSKSGQEDGRPFFLYVPYTAPHTPWVPSEPYSGQTEVGHYGDFVAQVDASVHRIAQAVQEAGIEENTLFIVTSDNGSHWPDSDIERWSHDGNMGWRGQKADIWEGGHRIPLLIRWPGITEPDTVSNQTVCLTDLFATCAQAGDATWGAEAGEDSVDLGPILRKEDWSNPRQAVIHQSGDGMLAIRVGDWKLIEAMGSGGFTSPKRPKPDGAGPTGQLYNLAKDPGESTNLWIEEPERVARMQALLANLRKEGRSVAPPTRQLPAR
ncbi:MAG: arylsulfatase [Planctomycetota bacterium]|nr:arylsulfatase [Planctomycetota bacterium]